MSAAASGSAASGSSRSHGAPAGAEEAHEKIRSEESQAAARDALTHETQQRLATRMLLAVHGCFTCTGGLPPLALHRLPQHLHLPLVGK